ncbi:MAG: sensor histidine kinase [Planctomycetota bacterium]
MNTETLHILVVDDEPGMRLGVVRALRDYTVHLPDIDCEVSFTTDQAETGEAAIEKIQTSPPDILLLDHKLPGMSGLDVLAELGEMDADVLTIMITAYASLETAITATKRGAYDFLAKPFTPQELKGTINKAAGRLILSRQAKRLADEKRQVRFQFIRVLGHELKAPLAAIEGYLKIIRDRAAGEDPEAYDRMLDRSLVRLDGMRKLILDLLDLTRIESGQKQRELGEVDLRKIAEAAVETALPQAQEREITVELHDEGPVPMTGDQGELEIVLNNLVSNAVKYNRDGGRVDVTLEADDGEVTVAVSDTGIGMSEEEQNKLFQEFTRIKNEKTRNILGSGLGLSIVRKIASLYGGRIEVDSEPDVGSTFTLHLQRHAQPANQPAETTGAAEG